MRKKILSIFLCSIMIIILTGCNDFLFKRSSEREISKTNDEQNEFDNTTTEEKSCTPKKFSNKYSYVYESKETCMKNGNEVFLDLTDDGLNVFTYGCEEIVDDCGSKYFGLYFNEWNDETEQAKKIYY